MVVLIVAVMVTEGKPWCENVSRFICGGSHDSDGEAWVSWEPMDSGIREPHDIRRNTEL